MFTIPGDPQQEELLKRFEEIDSAYRKWLPLQSKADQGAYAVLGMMFELAHDIDADETGRKRGILETSVAAMVKVEGGKRWSAGGKATTELLVTNLLGVKENRSRKHNWVHVLGYANEQGIDPTKKGFVDWISAFKGGIEGVLDEVRGFDQPKSTVKFDELIEKVSDSGEHPVIEMEIEGVGKASILVVRKNDEGKIEVIRTVKDEAKVKKVLIDLVGKSRMKNLTEAGIIKLERQSLRTLLSVSLKLYDNRTCRAKDVLRFSKAKKKLENVPALYEKYFDASLISEGEKTLSTFMDDSNGGDKSTIDIQHSDYHPLDPGRFIGNAKPGALLPFDIGEKTDREVRRAVSDYLDDTKEFRLSPREPSNSGRSLAEFLQDDECEMEEEEEPSAV